MERDQPEFCDDCPLVDYCANQGQCGAFEVLYPVGETGIQEQLQDCSNAHNVLYNNAFKIPELQQKLESIREIATEAMSFCGEAIVSLYHKRSDALEEILEILLREEE